MEDHISQKDKRIIYSSYIFLFLSMFATLIPINIASVFSLMICVCTLAAIYSVRSNAEEDSILENHMTFLIRTFWRANLYLLISIMLAGIYIAMFADYSAITPCVSYINDHLATIIENSDISRIKKIMEPCSNAFYNNNKHYVMVTILLALLPLLTYLIYRCFFGCVFLRKSKLIPEAKL